MKNQQIQLINILKEARTAKTSSSLANALNISPRSVKTYINEINEMLPGTISSSRSGYVIDAEKADALLNDTKTLIPQTSDERMSYAVNRIIKQGVVNAYDLCRIPQQLRELRKDGGEFRWDRKQRCRVHQRNDLE